MNEDEGAKYHFELVLGSAEHKTLENNIRNFINRIDRRRRWQLGGYLTLAPSTNFNRGSAHDTVDLNGLTANIDDTGKQKSGIGVLAGINAGYRIPLTKAFDLMTGISGTVRDYKGATFDDWNTSVYFGPRFSFKDGFVAAYASFGRRWYAHKGYSKFRGGRVQATRRLSKRVLVSGTAGCNWLEYDIADHQDGRYCTASGIVNYYFSNAMFARFLGGGGRDNTARDHIDATAWHIGAGLHREFAWGITIYGQVRYEARRYDGDFPGWDENRRDNRVDVSLIATKRDWNWRGFAPQVEYTYTRNFSNIPFYDYSAHSVNVMLTKRF